MKWWRKFIDSVDAIPLRIEREKSTMKQKKKWIEQSTAKSLAMIIHSLEIAYGKEYAMLYLN
ncbi:hypothetical protein VL4N_13780 [Vagococcus lutrae]|uniref:replication initiation factor domain-containing protein n=1 Tax=Vagococcus lutrae TaxID=81947 RepID=UPI001926BFFD|nr:replication initiation factor domain-containing protein [Vagococcus lutrae]GEQ62016.1 hypothetical protein VL2N_13520 [Vagococcus lutrae]GEQ63937.1 hypothetical protein VL3N_13790 [Vagococcus lutrae]GEQ65828.1 hypothetical protein VL4N_13780 [Vagococcus lutrae]